MTAASQVYEPEVQCPAGVGVRQLAVPGGQRERGLRVDGGGGDAVQGGGQRRVVRVGVQPRLESAAGLAPALLRRPELQLRGVERERVGQHSLLRRRRCAVHG